MHSSRLMALPIFAALLLSGCSSVDDSLLSDQPVDDLYSMALKYLEDEKFEDASKVFDEVDRQHPYSKWATKAQLMSAFSFYQAQKYHKAIAGLETFIQLHPGHSDAAYAHYVLALCYYEQIFSVRRDQDMARQALEAFEILLRRFPESKYAKDAKYKMDLTVDHLAGKEMSIGRYYLKRGSYIAAINRFRKVVDGYDTTSHAPEALHRLTECYISLNMKEEAKASAAVLGHNFPESPWYADSYYVLEGKDLRPEDSKVQASLLNRMLGKRLEG